MTAERETLARLVADAMIEHGPDGHTDGADEIAAAALTWMAAELDRDGMREAAARAMDEILPADNRYSTAKVATRALAVIRERLAPDHPPEAGTGEGSSG